MLRSCSFIPVAGCIISTFPIGFVALTEYGFLKLALVILMVFGVHVVGAQPFLRALLCLCNCCLSAYTAACHSCRKTLHVHCAFMRRKRPITMQPSPRSDWRMQRHTA